MSTGCKGRPSRTVNYFSNPDVKFGRVPMGNAANNCAQKIRDNMVRLAKVGAGI